MLLSTITLCHFAGSSTSSLPGWSGVAWVDFRMQGFKIHACARRSRSAVSPTEAVVDEQTLQFYRSNAQSYAAREIATHTRLNRFLARLPAGAAILELGCGAGAASAEMIARGFDVRSTDGSPEMAAEASRRLGRPVETLLFHDLDKVETYDGVWANACLLHVPRDELAPILSLIWRALKPGGYFYASYKTGDADGRDTLNRYYNYPSAEWLRTTYGGAGSWSSLSIEAGEVRGFDDKWSPMLFVVVRKSL
jgi:SAM-dependent methyltransferase